MKKAILTTLIILLTLLLFQNIEADTLGFELACKVCTPGAQFQVRKWVYYDPETCAITYGPEQGPPYYPP